MLTKLPALSVAPEDEATLYSLATEFLSAANILLNTPPTELGHSVVTYYLAGHSAELFLKSYLFKKGITADELAKQYGHSLKLLIKKSRGLGLPEQCSTENIEKLGNIYTKKRTEYRQNKVTYFPPLDLLVAETGLLKEFVFDHIFEFISENK